jgi:hypothetical protein
MTGLEELRAYLAKIHHKQLPLLERATAEQLLAVAEAARNLGVHWRERDPETMVSMNIRMAMRRLEDALAPLLEDSKGGNANYLPTKVNTPQSDARNAAPVATQARAKALEGSSHRGRS